MQALQAATKNNIGPPSSPQLGREEKANPLLVVHDFCNGYHFHEVKQILWDWLVTAMSKNHSIYDVGKERSNLIFFYEKLSALVEAAYLIHQKQQPVIKPKKTAPKNTKSASRP